MWNWDLRRKKASKNRMIKMEKFGTLKCRKGEIKFSIIVPVYNSEKYLKKCLDSIKNQTWEGYEVILVDDGSTDGSRSICDSYAKFDSRFKVIHKEHGGPGSARKEAANVVAGDYVLSVDSDDWISKGYLEKIALALAEYMPDMAAWNYSLINEKGHCIDCKRNLCKSGLYIGEQLHKLKQGYLFDAKENGLNGGNLIYSLWTKAISRDIYVRCQNMIDKPIGWGDDAMIIFLVMQEIQSLVVLENDGYMFRANPESVTHRPDTQELYRVDNVVRMMLQNFDANQMELNQIYAYAANILFLLLYRYAVSDISNYKQMASIAKKLRITKYASRAQIKEGRIVDKVKMLLLRHNFLISLGLLCWIHQLYQNIRNSHKPIR